MIAHLTTGAEPTYVLTTPWTATIVDRHIFLVKFHAENTWIPTININWNGDKALVDAAWAWLTAWLLKGDATYILQYNLATNNFWVSGWVGGGSWWGGEKTVYISPAQDMTIAQIRQITHNLNVIEADVMSGRYKVKFSFKWDGGWWVYSWQYRETLTQPVNSGLLNINNRDAGDPSDVYKMFWQSNTLKCKGWDATYPLYDVRAHIIDTRAT